MILNIYDYFASASISVDVSWCFGRQFLIIVSYEKDLNSPLGFFPVKAVSFWGEVAKMILGMYCLTCMFYCAQ